MELAPQRFILMVITLNGLLMCLCMFFIFVTNIILAFLKTKLSDF